MPLSLISVSATATRTNGDPGDAPDGGNPAQQTVSGTADVAGSLSMRVTVTASDGGTPGTDFPDGPWDIVHNYKVGESAVEAARALGQKCMALSAINCGNGAQDTGNPGPDILAYAAFPHTNVGFAETP